jgi:hypothetical protein
MSTQEKRKLEVFIARHTYNDIIGGYYDIVTSCKALLNRKEYIQVSEIVEVEFTMKPKGYVINTRPRALDKKIEEAKGTLSRGTGKQCLSMKKDSRKFAVGEYVTKVKGSRWEGKVVGFYSTELTPEGYCVESSVHKGSVQIYPGEALERIETLR